MLTANQNAITAILKNAGLRPTLARVTVMAVLMECDELLTVPEIFNRQKPAGIGINLGTVYTALKQLTRASVVTAHTDMGRKVMYSLSARKAVGVMICTRCGKNITLDAARIQTFVRLICADQGACAESFRLHVSATCGSCASKGG